MVLFVLLVTTILLYDLVFNISCFFPEKCFFFLHFNCGICFIQSCHNGFDKLVWLNIVDRFETE